LWRPFRHDTMAAWHMLCTGAVSTATNTTRVTGNALAVMINRDTRATCLYFHKLFHQMMGH
jgi:hypothetical protein